MIKSWRGSHVSRDKRIRPAAEARRQELLRRQLWYGDESDAAAHPVLASGWIGDEAYLNRYYNGFDEFE